MPFHRGRGSRPRCVACECVELQWESVSSPRKPKKYSSRQRQTRSNNAPARYNRVLRTVCVRVFPLRVRGVRKCADEDHRPAFSVNLPFV